MLSIKLVLNELSLTEKIISCFHYFIFDSLFINESNKLTFTIKEDYSDL